LQKKNFSKLKRESTYVITVKGLVQGVGFRPFIYKLALSFNLKGTVENRNDGVLIKVNAYREVLNSFIEAVKKDAPPASDIELIDFVSVPFEYFADFIILKSSSVSESITDVSPDIAVCNDCLNDMKTQKNRINYPFINCTNCGPRFSIIKDLPYDREKTSMKPFKMCTECYKEYSNIFDRRFHAQPTACVVCGPEYLLQIGKTKIKKTEDILEKLAFLIDNGHIVAIKGLGGFFLACDALNERAVLHLRKQKNREGKPFALMFSCINTLKEYAEVNHEEEKALLSLKRPIVLLKQKKQTAFSVTVGFDTIGAMLPYMPIHYLMFEKLKTPAIVLTSGNISDAPIIIDNNKAISTFEHIADAVLTYNRDIYNRVDDSVVTIINKKERVFRRSRGYAPVPIKLKKNVDGILSTGAELVNCFCIGKDNQAILSQHIGDLKNYETYEFYVETIEKYKKLFRFEPKLVVSDLHPNYLSTRYAEETKLPHIKIQHHYAHIASCMAEHNLEEKVIGVCFDGTGYGTDNNIWGSEFFICDLKGFERINHFSYVPLPGGDKVTSEPWRMAVSYLFKFYGREFLNMKLPFLKKINKQHLELLCDAIEKNINCPLGCSAGRLFDAVAALTDICTESKFHAEAPMRLESIIDSNIKESYSFTSAKDISFEKMFKEILSDIQEGLSPSLISTKFHNTIMDVVVSTVKGARRDFDIDKVVLSGGTFQNKYLSEQIENRLTDENFKIFISAKIPVNDAGIALGQLFVASQILNDSK